jgi:hypothetical protein
VLRQTTIRQTAPGGFGGTDSTDKNWTYGDGITSAITFDMNFGARHLTDVRKTIDQLRTTSACVDGFPRGFPVNVTIGALKMIPGN